MSGPQRRRRGPTLDELLEIAARTYARGEETGEHGSGAFNLGFVLERQGDLDGAAAAYRRADEAGHAGAAVNLGLLLERQGDIEGAEAALQRAVDRGHLEAAQQLARLLEDRGDVQRAAAVRGALGDAVAKKRPPNMVLIGILGTLAVLAVTFLTYTKRIPFVPRYHVNAVFSSTNQLRPGSPVRMAGVDVGKVTGFRDGPGSTQIATLEIKNDNRPIHTDAFAKIRPRFFLEGAFYVELLPGTPSAPEMKSGGTIPLSRTAIPVQFSQVLSALTRPVRAQLRKMVIGLADTFDKGGAQAFGRAMTPLAPAMRDTSLVAEAARGTQPHDMSDLIRGLSQVTYGLGHNDRDLAQLLTALNRTTGAMAADSAGLRGTVREIDNVLRAAPPAFTALQGALPPTETFAAAIRPALRISPPVLRRADALFAQLRLAVRPAQLPRLLSTLRPALVALPAFSRNLRVLFPLVKPVSDCVRDHVIPVLDAKLDDGRLSSGRPVWQDLVHAASGLSGATQDFDANGTAVRYGAGIGPQTLMLGGGLSGGASSPVLGTRPRWLGPGVSPPYRPDQPCRNQAPPNLRARGDGALASTRTVSRPAHSMPRLTREQLRRLLLRVTREARR
jgi:virulence factor Mce-like protein